MTTDTRVLVLIGAGSAVFTRGLLADLIGARRPRRVGHPSRRRRPDAPRRRRPTRRGDGRGARRRATRSASSSSTDRRAVLAGADFVVTCVGVGGRPAWQLDHEIVQRHGIYPAGRRLDHAGRHLPAAAHHAGARRDRSRHRRARARRVLLQLLEPDDRQRAGDPPRDGARRRGPLPRHAPHPARARPAHRRAVRAHLDAVRGHQPPDVHLRLPPRRPGRLAARSGSACTASSPRTPDPADIGNIFYDTPTAWHNPFAWELFDRYGAFAAAGDRHVVEFFPERFAGGRLLRQEARHRRVLAARDPGLGREPLPGRCVRQAHGEEPLDQSIFERSGGEQEQLIAIIRSITFDSREMFSCNVVNNGLVPGLPDWSAVEIPGVATGARHPAASAVPDLGKPLTAILARRLIRSTSRSRPPWPATATW